MDSRGLVQLFLYPRPQRRVSGQRHTPTALPPGNETLYQIQSTLDGPQGCSERVRKISPTPDFFPRIFQSVMSRFTYNIILIHLFLLLLSYFYIALFFLSLFLSLILPFYSCNFICITSIYNTMQHQITCEMHLSLGLIKTWFSPTTAVSLSLSLEQNLNNRPCSCSELYYMHQENHTSRQGFQFWSIIVGAEDLVSSRQISLRGMSSCYPPCHANFED